MKNIYWNGQGIVVDSEGVTYGSPPTFVPFELVKSYGLLGSSMTEGHAHIHLNTVGLLTTDEDSANWIVYAIATAMKDYMTLKSIRSGLNFRPVQQDLQDPCKPAAHSGDPDGQTGQIV